MYICMYVFVNVCTYVCMYICGCVCSIFVQSIIQYPLKGIQGNTTYIIKHVDVLVISSFNRMNTKSTVLKLQLNLYVIFTYRCSY